MPIASNKSNYREERMGTFRTECVLENHQDRTHSLRVSGVMVDTGSEATWIKREYLEKIGIRPEKKKLRFIMANGQEVTRSIGYAIIHVGQEATTDEIVFAQEGDLQLLGARTLEGLNLRVDPRNKKLVSGGPIVAAGHVTFR